MSRVLQSGSVGAAVALLLFATTPGHASSLVGDVVTCATSLQSGCTPASATVGAGPEFQVAVLEADIGESSIRLTNVSGLSINFTPGGTVTFGDLDSSLGDITGIVDVVATNISGILDVGDLTFTADSVTVNFMNTFWFASATPANLVFSLTFENQQIPVPAPASLLLMLLAGGLGLAAWRRRR